MSFNKHMERDFHSKRIFIFMAVYNCQPQKSQNLRGYKIRFRWYYVFSSQEVDGYLKELEMSFLTLNLVQVVNES